MTDRFGRNIHYLRVSLTDKCNLRCRYCMPDGVKLVPMEDILTMEETAAIIRQAAMLGIDRVKLTGGEPLVRKGFPELCHMIKEIREIREVTLTTNGILLDRYLPDLKDLGIRAINISLDTLDPQIYKMITGSDELDRVYRTVLKAAEQGYQVKINAVLLKELNPDAWKDLVLLARDCPVDVRFIELMPIGDSARMEGVSNADLLEELRVLYPEMERDPAVHGNGPAVYYHIPGFAGSIGMISALHGKFCKNCNRVRLTAMGLLKQCLCYSDGVDLKEILRNEGEEQVREAMRKAIYGKPKEHCFEKKEQITEEKRMYAIGG